MKRVASSGQANKRHPSPVFSSSTILHTKLFFCQLTATVRGEFVSSQREGSGAFVLKCFKRPNHGRKSLEQFWEKIFSVRDFFHWFGLVSRRIYNPHTQVHLEPIIQDPSSRSPGTNRMWKYSILCVGIRNHLLLNIWKRDALHFNAIWIWISSKGFCLGLCNHSNNTHNVSGLSFWIITNSF